MKQCPVCAKEYPDSLSYCPDEGAALRPLAVIADLVGTVLDGKYRILRLLGAGGMGNVYLAEHVILKRQCALKTLKPELLSEDPSAAARFTREASNASRIDHPNVVAVHDFGVLENGLLYFAMEYVEGETLEHLVERDGPMAPELVLPLMRQVAEALEAAHSLGIVHRDLKPANVLVGVDRQGKPRAKVADFGIAKAVLDNDQRITRTGMVLGTPAFMSPEQLSGSPVDARSDIYSFGLLAAFALTGSLPVAMPGDPDWVLSRITGELLPPTRSPNAPYHWGTFESEIAHALAAKPDDRYQTAVEFAGALEARAQRQSLKPSPGVTFKTTTLMAPFAVSATIKSVRWWRWAASVAALAALGVVGAKLIGAPASVPANGTTATPDSLASASPPAGEATRLAPGNPGPLAARETKPADTGRAKPAVRPADTAVVLLSTPLASTSTAPDAGLAATLDSLSRLSGDEGTDRGMIMRLSARSFQSSVRSDSVLVHYYLSRYEALTGQTERACLHLDSALRQAAAGTLATRLTKLKADLQCP